MYENRSLYYKSSIWAHLGQPFVGSPYNSTQTNSSQLAQLMTQCIILVEQPLLLVCLGSMNEGKLSCRSETVVTALPYDHTHHHYGIRICLHCISLITVLYGIRGSLSQLNSTTNLKRLKPKHSGQHLPVLQSSISHITSPGEILCVAS